MAIGTLSLSHFKNKFLTKRHKFNVSSVEDRTWRGVFRCREQKIVFDSKKEMNRFVQLLFLLKEGAIYDLQLQERFLLLENKVGNKVFKTKYVADFSYFEKGGRFVVEDVKGRKTPEYLKKKKIFMAKYPDIIFLET